MLEVDAVHPNHGPTRRHLGVNGPAAAIPFQYAHVEADCVHKEALSRLQVLVDSQGDDWLTPQAGFSLCGHPQPKNKPLLDVTCGLRPHRCAEAQA